MFSDMATEKTIKTFVQEIKRKLEDNRGKPEVCFVLRELGRFALTQFEWDTPNWAKECQELFKEQQ